MMDEEAGRPVAAFREVTDIPLQLLVNTFCAQVDLPVATKQQLLRMDDVLERGLVLTDLILRESDRRRRSREADDSRDRDDDATVH